VTPEQQTEELKRVAHSPELNRLHADIRFEVARDLHNFRAREKELSAKSADKLLMMYMNWRFRLIHAHPRGIYLSAELCSKRRSNDSLLTLFQNGFDRLIKMIAAGEDLTDCLSPRVRQKPYRLDPDSKKINDQKHLDLLLNEQGIHHLHLPGSKNAPILFAIFEREHAFILDIASHDDWSTDRLARISYRNWGQRHFVVLKMDRLVSGRGDTVNLKDHERVFVRNCATNTSIKIEENLFVFPRTGGLAANGYSASVVRQCNKICNSLAFFGIRRHRPGFSEYFERRAGKPLPENPEFRFRFLETPQEWAYAIIEEKTLFPFLLPDGFGVVGVNCS
jgi:hypothetical protein